jgi:predicted metalloprotease with PDZ domain
MPNGHYNDMFDYAYSGLELYYVDDKIILGDVAVNSPAALAGLKEGDVVVGINNIVGNNIQLFKMALQGVRERIRIIITRNGDLKEFNFKTKSILK